VVQFFCQYDYDCFTQITQSKRRRSVPDRMSRRGSSVARRSVSEGRIAKDKAKKRASVGTGVIGSQVFISGAPVTTLRNLLDEVEAEVSFIGPPAKSVYETPVRRRSLDVSDLSFVSSLLNQEGERHWVKDDWKLLDTCFTDERFVVGGNLRIGGDGLADVDVIDLGHVVDRYVGILGGEELVKRFGPGWERYCARFIDISIINISLQRCNSTTRKSTSEEATFWHCRSPYYSFVVADSEPGHDEHHSRYSGLHSCSWNVQTDDAPCAASTNCGQCPLPGLT
jgi:hypothetical protein